jgi:hypothetical protein
VKIGGVHSDSDESRLSSVSSHRKKQRDWAHDFEQYSFQSSYLRSLRLELLAELWSKPSRLEGFGVSAGPDRETAFQTYQDSGVEPNQETPQLKGTVRKAIASNEPLVLDGAVLSRITISFFGLLAGASIAMAETKCSELEGAKPQTLLDYLRRDRSTTKAPCISSAMFQIVYPPDGQVFDGDPGAIKIIVGYLDYRMPEESKLAAFVSKNRDAYPADVALFVIGKPALPYLIDAIASSSTSPIAQSNAIWVVFLIHGEDKPGAVRALSRASKASQDFERSLRLFDAARKAANMCTGPNINRCIDALYADDPDRR